MKKRLNAALGIILASASALAADPALLQLLPPEASVVAGLQVDQGRNSPFGKYLLSRMSTDQSALAKLISETGLDPQRDLAEIVFAGASLPAGTKSDGSGIVVARGTFNPARIASAVQAHGGTLSSFQGIDLLTGGRNGGNWGLALLDTTTVALGNVDSVEAVITRHAANTPVSADLTTRVQALSSSNDFWFLTLAPLSEFASVVPDAQLGNALQNGQLFQAVTHASGGVKFGDNVVFTADAVTRSDKDAQALADVMRFMASMIQTNKQNNPTVQQMATLLSSLVLTTDANVLHISLSVPEAQVEAFLAAAKHHPAAPKLAAN